MNYYASIQELNDRYDSRTSKELSQDRNVADPYSGRIQRILDAQAARLDGYLVNLFGSVPISVPKTSLASAATALDTSISVTNGLTVTPYEYIIILSDGTNQWEKVLVQSISGNTLTLSSLTPLVYSHNSGSTIATVPMPMTDWVCAQTESRCYFRRTTEPPALKTDLEMQTAWLNELLEGKLVLPGVQKAVPGLLISSRTDGSSQFDNVFGTTKPDWVPLS